ERDPAIDGGRGGRARGDPRVRARGDPPRPRAARRAWGGTQSGQAAAARGAVWARGDRADEGDQARARSGVEARARSSLPPSVNDHESHERRKDTKKTFFLFRVHRVFFFVYFVFSCLSWRCLSPESCSRLSRESSWPIKP